MGNYKGKTNLLKVKVDNENPKKGLIEIINSLDSDYEEYADKIVDNIIKQCESENKDVIDMIDNILVGNFGEIVEGGINVLDDISNFFLQNCTYCSGYESDIVDQGKSQLVIISYGS
jgi:hypothetical protein